MIISFQGIGHYTKGINNQDFGIETPNMLLILDGCSDCRFSEIGTRLFAQFFSRKEDCDSVELFEKNAKKVFEDILKLVKPYYHDQEEFIMNNLLFTIFACFETEDKFIVKYFGDGYILTKNKAGCLSYIRLTYGKTPPYLAYRYCPSFKDNYGKFDFKTIEFSKDDFSNVGIGTDGIAPFAKRIVTDADKYWFSENETALKAVINHNRSEFYDDVTAAYFGGQKNVNI